MNLKTNYPLKQHNTLRLEATADYFVRLETLAQLERLAQDQKLADVPWLILGEGSNILFSQDFNGLVLHNQLTGRETLGESTVELEVSAGENWHQLVKYTVENHWGGIENLALIPGTVGAAPVQNIAAYGQNFSDVCVLVSYFDRQDQQHKTIDAAGCQFAYRDSIFKHELKDRAIITAVRLRLQKEAALETSYYSIGGRTDSIRQELAAQASQPYSIEDVFKAVVAIRQRKLLDWQSQPTVGSFFINPIVSRKQLHQLRQRDPELQYYPVDDLSYHTIETPELSQAEYVKVPVGRLLDFLGWKGKRLGNCRVHQQLASIFTHNGQATGAEFLAFTNTIKKDVYDRLGIVLETEVTIV